VKLTLLIAICLSGVPLLSTRAEAEPPQITVSTNVIGPPEFRSYELTKVVKRGETEILRDIRHGPSKDATLRMQHVIHDGQAVYSVRETREDTVVSSTHGATVSVMFIDVDRNAKPDLLLLLKGGRTAEAYLVEKDGFLSPAPAQILFNKGGTILHHETVVQNVRTTVSQQDKSRVRGKAVSPQGLGDEVTIRWQAKSGVAPQGMLPVATTYVAALNQNQIDKALEWVYKDQRDRFGDYLRRNRRARQLVVDRVTVFRGDYNMEGGKVRDLLMAKVHTREVGGEGGMSFLMIRIGDTWWVVGG